MVVSVRWQCVYLLEPGNIHRVNKLYISPSGLFVKGTPKFSLRIDLPRLKGSGLVLLLS